MAERFQRMADATAHAVGTVWAFGAALLSVLVWGATGPLFHFSNGWNFAINSSTTVITFLMVFLIQATQNRQDRALNVKLDELLVRLQGPRSEVAHAERLPERELERLADEQTPNGAADYVE